MDFSFQSVRQSGFLTSKQLPPRQALHIPSGHFSRYLAGASLLFVFLVSPFACAGGDAEKGRSNWEYTCQHCHGVPQPYKAAAFSDYDTTANKLSLYASDPAAITRSATVGYTVPAGNSSDKVEPGQNTNLAMGTWAGGAWNRLGSGSTPTQYAIDFAAYFATFFEVPGAPTITSVTAGSGQATVNFTAPKSDLAITSYTVTANPGGFAATGTASPIVVTGLSGEVAYTFTVKAASNAGTGKSSSASNAVTLVAVQQTAAVRSAPATAATSAPTPSIPAPAIKSTSLPAASVPANQPSFPKSNPVATTVAVAPVIAAAVKPAMSSAAPAVSKAPGVSAPVAANKVVALPAATNNMPGAATLPAPTITAAKPGSSEARVFFTVPQDALALIANYTVIAYSGGKPTGINASGSNSPIKITGLTNGIDYVFYVFANGKSGARVPSTASSVVTPLSIFGE
jgi:hypothetical protein